MATHDRGRSTAPLLLVLLCVGMDWSSVARAQDYNPADYGEAGVPFMDIDEDHVVLEDSEEFPFAQGTRVNYSPGGTSRYWGQAGELFSYTGRMSDWSWVGYRMGERQPPSPAAGYSLVTNFGANGNDNLPDTAAFAKAFQSVPSGGVLYLPAGRFILDQPLTRNTPIIIRGAGRDLTTIYMPKSLNDLNPWRPSAADPLSPYRDDPFFITLVGVLGVSASTQLGVITAKAWRGERFVTIQPTPGVSLAVGNLVRIVAGDRNSALITYLYGNLTQADWGKPCTDLINKSPLLFFSSRIKGVRGVVGGNAVVELERPLPFDLKPGEWNNVGMHKFSWGALTETGIEDITFESAPSVYAGHLTEAGYNAVGISGCYNCWTRRVRFTNVDIGLHVENSFFFTVDDVQFKGDRTGGGVTRYSGHHGIRFSRTADCIAKNVQFDGQFVHELTLDHYAHLNVFHNFVGPDLAMDYHSQAPSMNLMSRINCGKCTRNWASGGGAGAGGHAGLFNMAWGLTAGDAAGNMAPMWSGFAANFTIIGAPLNVVPSYNGFVLEPLDPTQLRPWDLQAAQLSWRLLRSPPIVQSSLSSRPPAPPPRPSSPPSPPPSAADPSAPPQPAVAKGPIPIPEPLPTSAEDSQVEESVPQEVPSVGRRV